LVTLIIRSIARNLAIEVEDVELAKERAPWTKVVRRSVFDSAGPNEQWACDGHDKLSSIGLPVYGFRDKYGRKLLDAYLCPSNRVGRIVLRLYWETVKDIGGVFCAPGHAEPIANLCMRLQESVVDSPPTKARRRRS
jgi:hypothetical protein